MNVATVPWEAIEQSEWFQTRPPAVQDVIRRYPPTQYYRYTPTDKPCTIYSYEENKDDTITVKADMPSSILLPTLEHRVFGVQLDDLEPWPDFDYPRWLYNVQRRN